MKIPLTLQINFGSGVALVLLFANAVVSYLNIQKLRDNERWVIHILTSSRQNSDINSAYDLGANSYLVKPVSLAALVEVVQTLNLYWLLLNEKPEISQC